MFERTKISLAVSIIAFAAIAWALGHFTVPDGSGKLVPLMEAYASYYDIAIGIGIAIVLASGLNLVNGHTGQFSLGHAAFMGLGAYFASMVTLGIEFPLVPYPEFAGAPAWLVVFKSVAWVLAMATNSLLSLLNAWVTAAHHLPMPVQFVAALVVGGLVAAVAGLLVGVPSLRLKGDYLAIVTLGFNEIIRVVIQNAEPLGAQRGLGGMPLQTNVFWTFSAAALTIYVVRNLVNSTYGRGFLAVRDDEIAAEAMGINTTKYKVLAFVTAAFFAGIAGGLYAHFKQFITPDGFNFMKSVDIVVMVILGGMGSTVGVCVAAALLTVLPEWLRLFSQSEALKEFTLLFAGGMQPAEQEKLLGRVQELFSNRMIFYSLILIGLMLLRPQGLFAGWGRKGARQ
jgi:branched-chain amino acid transport system permease protein